MMEWNEILVVVAKFTTLDVKGYRAKIPRLGLGLVRRHENELCSRFNELLDEPWTRHAVDFNFFASNPFHKPNATCKRRPCRLNFSSELGARKQRFAAVVFPFR